MSIKYTTLLEFIMKRLKADLLVFVTQNLTYMHGLADGARLYGKGEFNGVLRKPISDDKITKEQAQNYEAYEKELSELELNMCAKTLAKLREAMSKSTTNYGQIDEICKEFNGRLADELESKLIFSIESDKIQYLMEKNLFGMEVTEAFPSATVDIEEAGKCLAFERWTASVFHLSRVVEIGLRVLGNTLKLPETTNRNWESVLKKCDVELAKPLALRSPEWSSDDLFFSGATAFLRSVKDAWRNPTMHIDKVYTEEQTEDIWNAVKGFMRQIATKLKEEVA